METNGVVDQTADEVVHEVVNEIVNEVVNEVEVRKMWAAHRRRLKGLARRAVDSVAWLIRLPMRLVKAGIMLWIRELVYVRGVLIRSFWFGFWDFPILLWTVVSGVFVDAWLIVWDRARFEERWRWRAARVREFRDEL